MSAIETAGIDAAEAGSTVHRSRKRPKEDSTMVLLWNHSHSMVAGGLLDIS